ncbi:3-deoxy-manno-octulosonate cytidylyltransferase [Flavobacterium magnum]|uniref:3-deoxy-manno-octulosonate cytidylyltransferase n=1 Tax=Flavobacterium magnum TaxID=2162713 RepID=A0A2S0RBH7_9FLAO|nr:3-deoxy-manno-octulosonate cytidylyltransferase [Flavobacterium magnum]AWA28640.1 3-deoxy-manno-octulosonate cytidylyltransferase [Flavobacterium magnum]
MEIVLIIPARYKSTRFPGKPLTDIKGKSMILRVFEQCAKAFPKEKIYVATEDSRIVDHCNQHGMQAILTSDNCLTGTDRIAEAALQIDADYYINVQGDEPVFNPEDITTIISKLEECNGEVINGYCAIDTDEQYRSSSVPKVVFRPDGRMLYMSRSPIPGNKNHTFIKSWRQVCIYAFPKKALAEFASIKEKTPLEDMEDIEILRFLEMGYEVRMLELSNDSVPVDHPEDLEKVLERLKDE